MSNVINKCHWRNMFYGRYMGNKIRKLMTINLYRESDFQIYCGHWFWAVEKKVGYMMERQYALFV